MQSSKIAARLSALEYGLILICFAICLTGATLLPVNQCPDEFDRSRLIVWMVERGTLPTGDELETFALDPPPDENYGFSFALRPYLSAMIGAAFVKIAALFSDSDRVLLLASRMGSVLSVAGSCWFCLRLGRRLFDRRGSAVLFATIVCFLPQVLFLGMYYNNDSLSLLAVCAMLYYLVDGYDKKWNVGCCVGLGVAFSVGLLSYYSIYGWILMCVVFCLASVLLDSGFRDKGRLILKRALLIMGICLALAGWFFIRGALIHNGDFLGINYEHVSRARVASLGYILHPFESYRDFGMSVPEYLRVKGFEWFWMTVRSFVGVFGNLNIIMPDFIYGVYYTIIALGVLRFFAVRHRGQPDRRDRLLFTVMIVSTGINIALHFWQSYARDYQPQGRYIISLILPIAYMLACGADQTALTVRNHRPGRAAELNPAAGLVALWLLLFIWAALGSMTRMLP